MIVNFLDLERITFNFKKKRLSLLGCVYVLHKNIALANFTSLMRKIRQSNIPKTGCTCMAVLCCCCCLRQDLFYFTSSLPASLQFLKLLKVSVVNVWNFICTHLSWKALLSCNFSALKKTLLALVSENKDWKRKKETIIFSYYRLSQFSVIQDRYRKRLPCL